MAEHWKEPKKTCLCPWFRLHFAKQLRKLKHKSACFPVIKCCRDESELTDHWCCTKQRWILCLFWASCLFRTHKCTLAQRFGFTSVSLHSKQNARSYSTRGTSSQHPQACSSLYSDFYLITNHANQGHHLFGYYCC